MTRVANPWSDFAMAISADSDHQRKAMELLDYFYTDEGAEFYVYGIEGMSYGRDDDGNPTVHGWDDRLIGTKRYEIGYPSMFVSPIFLSRFLQGPRAVLMKDHFERTIPIMIGYPSLQTSGPEFEEMTNLFADLQTYVQESSNKFITGDLSVDSDWDGYVAQLKRHRRGPRHGDRAGLVRELPGVRRKLTRNYTGRGRDVRQRSDPFSVPPTAAPGR